MPIKKKAARVTKFTRFDRSQADRKNIITRRPTWRNWHERLCRCSHSKADHRSAIVNGVVVYTCISCPCQNFHQAD